MTIFICKFYDICWVYWRTIKVLYWNNTTRWRLLNNIRETFNLAHNSGYRKRKFFLKFDVILTCIVVNMWKQNAN